MKSDLPVMTAQEIERLRMVSSHNSKSDNETILALVDQAEARRREHEMDEAEGRKPEDIGTLFERAAEAWPRLRVLDGVLEIRFRTHGWTTSDGHGLSVSRALAHIDHCAMVLAAELGMMLEITEHPERATAMLRFPGSASSCGGQDRTRQLAILHMIRHCAPQVPETVVAAKMKTPDEAYAEGVRHGADAAKRRFPVAVPLEDLRRLLQMANSQMMGKTGALIVDDIQQLVNQAEKRETGS